MPGTVLVTGGFGLVGSATVLRLTELGRTRRRRRPRHRRQSRSGGEASTRCDRPVGGPHQRRSDRPNGCRRRARGDHPPRGDHPARHLSQSHSWHAASTSTRRPPWSRIAEAQPAPPRFVQASSNAVFGARNPHRGNGPVTADMPMKHADLYSTHKAEAEAIVRASSLEWVVLRLGGVLSVDPKAIPFNADALYFESLLPTDCRMHSVDVRDVAWAFAAATTADVAREILLIAGDDSHMLLYGDITPALAGCARTQGRAGAGPQGKPQQRRRLVRHRLDGHHPGAGSASVPALFVAGHDRRGTPECRLCTVSAAAGSAADPRGPQAARRLLEAARPVRRSMGRDPA